MRYQPYYPDGFEDLPSTDTPVDAAFLNGIESALAALAATVPVDYQPSAAYPAGAMVDHDGYCWIAKEPIPAGHAPASESSRPPTLVGSSSQRLVYGSSTHVMTIPDGVVAGDTLVYLEYCWHGSGERGAAVPEGWTGWNYTNNSRSNAIAEKVATEPMSGTVTFTRDSPYEGAAYLLVLRNATARLFEGATNGSGGSLSLAVPELDESDRVFALTAAYAGDSILTVADGVEVLGQVSFFPGSSRVFSVAGPRPAGPLPMTFTGPDNGGFAAVAYAGKPGEPNGWQRRYRIDND